MHICVAEITRHYIYLEIHTWTYQLMLYTPEETQSEEERKTLRLRDEMCEWEEEERAKNFELRRRCVKYE